MRTGLKRALAALGFSAATAAAQQPNRLVIVVAQPDDPRARQQHADFQQHAAALQARDVLTQDLTPEVARRERPELGVEPQAAFEILLVGKDGTVKLRRAGPVPTAEITALIDTMPMRQNEMRQRQP